MSTPTKDEKAAQTFIPKPCPVDALLFDKEELDQEFNSSMHTAASYNAVTEPWDQTIMIVTSTFINEYHALLDVGKMDRGSYVVTDAHAQVAMNLIKEAIQQMTKKQVKRQLSECFHVISAFQSPHKMAIQFCMRDVSEVQKDIAAATVIDDRNVERLDAVVMAKVLIYAVLCNGHGVSPIRMDDDIYRFKPGVQGFPKASAKNLTQKRLLVASGSVCIQSGFSNPNFTFETNANVFVPSYPSVIFDADRARHIFAKRNGNRELDEAIWDQIVDAAVRTLVCNSIKSWKKTSQRC